MMHRIASHRIAAARQDRTGLDRTIRRQEGRKEGSVVFCLQLSSRRVSRMPDSGRRQFAIYGYCLFCGRRRLILFPDLSYSSLQFSVKKVIASFGVSQLNIEKKLQ